MNYLDLFSGIGGFSLAARNAGWEFDSHYFSEIAPYPIKVYEKHFPEAVNVGDIKAIDGSKLRAEHKGDWIVTGGFPCQDLSTAGKGAGISGSRSGLWFEMLRVLRELQPKYIVIENVAALVTQGLDRVLFALAESGYDAEWQVIPGYAVGLPHRRERVFIVAYTREVRCGADRELFASGREVGNVGQDDDTIDWRAFVADWQHSVARDYGGQIPSEPVLSRKVDGVSAELDRVAALGNAIIPAIAERILRRLREIECPAR